MNPLKTSNQNFFRSIYKKNYRNKIVIENLLSLSYRRGKSMRYPESPKVKPKGSGTLQPRTPSQGIVSTLANIES